jgi:5,10-methenyltetrahydrofolate synthetase
MQDDENNGFASPPCFMHELDPAGADPEVSEDKVLRRDVLRWRRAERARLIALRQELSPSERYERAKQMAVLLDALLGDVKGLMVSGYWPMKGEPDLREYLTALRKRGASVALPCVIEKGSPLRFYLWEEGTKLERGVWNIPHPVDAKEVTPNIALAPVVGYDHKGYRLGYGGGYFDRTLASISPSPRAIGVGYRELELDTIYPLSHDIPMNEVIAI